MLTTLKRTGHTLSWQKGSRGWLPHWLHGFQWDHFLWASPFGSSAYTSLYSVDSITSV